MPARKTPRSHAQRRREQRDLRHAGRQRRQARVSWRSVPNAIRDWSELSSAQRTATAAKALIAAAIAIAVFVGILVGTAIFRELVVLPNTPVAMVNGTPITAKHYKNYLALRTYELDRQMDTTPPTANTRNSAGLQEQAASLVITAVTDLTNGELLRVEGPALGVVTTSAAIDAKLETFVRGPREIAADFEFASAFAEMRDELGIDAGTIRSLLIDRVLADEISHRLSAEMDQTPEQILASHIVTRNHDEAETVIARLNARQPFTLVAEEVSIDTSSTVGGSLGWMPRGLMPDGWETVAFALGPGGHSTHPVATKEGWHVILVHEKSNSRELNAAVATRLNQITFDAWLDTVRSTADIEFLLTPEIVAWAQRHLPELVSAYPEN